MAGTKTNAGNFFEDFRYGQIIPHATPRTVTDGDVALYTALYGSRFAVQSADTFAKAIGYPRAPLDDLLTFHVVFGKTTPDISLNAIANLGYAACRFLKPVYPGDTLSSVSEVIGLKENSNGETGTVYVRSTGRNQDGLIVLEYCRWVMVRKRDKASPPPEAVVPKLPDRVEPKDLALAIPPLDVSKYDFALAGSPHRWGDYEAGEKIDHVDGMTLGRSRASDGDAPLPEHGQSSLQSAHRIEGTVRQAHRLRRCRHLACAGAVLQWSRQRLPSGRHQRRQARRPDLRRRYDLCVVGGSRKS